MEAIYGVSDFKEHFDSVFEAYVKKNGQPAIFEPKMTDRLLAPLFNSFVINFMGDVETNAKKYKIKEVKYNPGKTNPAGVSCVDFQKDGSYRLVVDKDELKISAKRIDTSRNKECQWPIISRLILSSESKEKLEDLLEWFDGEVRKINIDSLTDFAGEFEFNLPTELKNSKALKQGLYKAYRINSFPYAGI